MTYLSIVFLETHLFTVSRNEVLFIVRESDLFSETRIREYILCLGLPKTNSTVRSKLVSAPPPESYTPTTLYCHYCQLW